VKRAFFHVAKALGLFALARRLTRRQLRILGYHGASIRNEHDFSPGTFMSAGTFEGRLDLLEAGGYPVLPLAEAVTRLRDGTLPPAATVITIDDGWYGTYRHMAPALKTRTLPATLYVSTYYVEKETQVFNMYLGYLLSRPWDVTLDMSSLIAGNGDHHDLRTASGRQAARSALLGQETALESADARQALLRKLSDALGVDWHAAEQDRFFTFMTPAEVTDAARDGIDIQLHTHRHMVPRIGSAEITREIADNRTSLENMTNGPFDHFCYPSGVHDQSHYPYLEAAVIKSAVTTDAGLAYASTHAYALPRILDSEALSLIELEAELSGFVEIARRVLKKAHI
jgi:peptidoglycan/xylan/chitin deacetylase (PgdA/CDA1 family)